MEQQIEKEIRLPHICVQLATVRWQAGDEERPPRPSYYLCQRLSDDHSPLRIGNLGTPEAFPRVRSVGFLPPGCEVRLFPMEKPFRLLNCEFEETFFERCTGLERTWWDNHMGDLVAIRNKRLEILMQEIHAELLQPDYGQELLIDAVATLLLVELARYARHLERKQSKHGASLALAPWQLRRIQERIAASLELGYPNLSELADICGISQSHLMRSFKAATGWQIHKYVAEERLKAAKTLLAQAEYSCQDVSEKLGFKSPAYFATAFRRMTGKTPTEFQRQARAKEVGG